MAGNRFSLQIADNLQVESAEQPETFKRPHSSQPVNNEEAAIAYYHENRDTLWQSMDAITKIVNEITDSFPVRDAMGKGLHTSIVVNSHDIEEGKPPHISVRFYDYQTKTNTQLTGACMGYMKALSEAGRSRNAAQIHWSDGYSSRTSITFNSLEDLVLALNARAKGQDEKITTGPQRPIAIG